MPRWSRSAAEGIGSATKRGRHQRQPRRSQNRPKRPSARRPTPRIQNRPKRPSAPKTATGSPSRPKTAPEKNEPARNSKGSGSGWTKYLRTDQERTKRWAQWHSRQLTSLAGFEAPIGGRF